MFKKQVFYFLIIGALASLVNFVLVFIIVDLNITKPLIANFFAYLIAFNVSYFGHRYFTFSKTTQSHKKAASQFFINALIGLALNEGIYSVLLHVLHIQYLIALFITMLLVAIYTFIVSKFLIFKA
ncbi:GtrA family protein [Allofrancisella guangzhouensis]|uniref:Polysaccharide biosynthesis protein GtrA n=1 Tax=Allofrancisella guangzhouensis TaxID=594679 RepID=A0A0A8E7W4_9GAMM|nr:GtrA family protein [Allofrancisella guangzhouensis]AJC48251.1 polysaccharide biosynthesis protein GtrA [Allofrancisella guangzhouensis]MBK2027521.1 GtrA family protein [Allofrancisella guangzhouensis]MBK2043756.1 GtrA family protein [Allofrancisella guangzhouensis]MBK2045258.1 GtrA family protein [Allofrancisella guangzhouensis]